MSVEPCYDGGLGGRDDGFVLWMVVRMGVTVRRGLCCSASVFRGGQGGGWCSGRDGGGLLGWGYWKREGHTGMRKGGPQGLRIRCLYSLSLSSYCHLLVGVAERVDQSLVREQQPAVAPARHRRGRVV